MIRLTDFFIVDLKRINKADEKDFCGCGVAQQRCVKLRGLARRPAIRHVRVQFPPGVQPSSRRFPPMVQMQKKNFDSGEIFSTFVKINSNNEIGRNRWALWHLCVENITFFHKSVSTAYSEHNFLRITFCSKRPWKFHYWELIYVVVFIVSRFSQQTISRKLT